MRLRRLDLTRYGKFTDHSIDFGQVTGGTPDFHIIYGLNEAGKSTIFAAFLDLLFGIPERSGYNFLHPYNAMKIGARLEFDGAEHELIRLKQRSGSLVDDRGQPVNEAMLAGALGGIGRDAYRTMFSLDDQSLKDGGNAIIQSKGELGELLFSASSGLAGLSKSLVAATEDAGAIYKKRSSSTKMAELKRTLEALKNERNTIDTFATAYAALTNSFQQANASYGATTSELAEAKARHQELARILGALPLATELARLTSDPAILGDLPRPPAEWFLLLPQLSRDETRLQALLESADRNIQQLASEIDEINVDEKALAIAAHIEMLDNGRARYRAAENDLPKRKLAFAEQDGMLSRLLADLEQSGHAHPEALLLPASSTGIIRDLIEKRSGIDAELAAAERELKRTRETLGRLREEGAAEFDSGMTIGPESLARIEAALARLTGSDLSSRLAVEERACAQLQRGFENQLALLAPWSGDASDLRALKSVEGRQIETWRTQAAAIEKRVADHQSKHRDLVTEQTLAKARTAAFAASGAIDDGEAHSLRAERDAAWQAHLSTLNRATAELFEERMRRDDTVTADRLSRAQELAELRQLMQATVTTAAAIERQQALLDEARTEYACLSEKIGALLPDALGAGPDALECLAALESWTSRRSDTLCAWDDLQKAEDEIEQIKSQLERHGAELVSALRDAGAEAVDHLPIGELARAAGDFLTHIKTRKAAKASHEKALIDLARDLAERERDHEDAKAAADAWHQAWGQALAKTWFVDKAGSVAAVREILAVLATLPGILKERQDMAQRVAAMERDQAEFRAEMTAILGELDGITRIDDTLDAANALVDRHNAALRNQQIRADKQADLERLIDNRQKLMEDLAVHNAQKAELTGYFGTDTLAAVSAFLEQAKERERVEKRIAELRDQIAQGLRTASHEEAQRLLLEIDVADVERSAMELSVKIDDLTERAKLLYAEMTRAKDRLDAVGGDDAVARIEAKRRTIFLEIEDHAVRYLTLRAGTLAAEQALHIYREKHRSSMMNRASEAFRLITGGNYSGLATQPDKDKEILIGVARDGGSKLADTMSTGTQFQLYLALRLAGYEEFAAVRPAVPFIADDIMESFDNPRSEEVFRLLGEMSRVGQVIYLTHHWHLCEIAKAVVPDVSIHELL
ncbi:hypothetical protein C5748_25960 [Phyllobacterium phragmitis]|uniref:YhaN AAA domain-containing protein n=1 Tax=Phyllobacterium phragmitis TaxID=2670329 RepID=A0A2S9IJC7_9HYPH|nr:AAA family ATPase [Phyllobacterium phragmitis]PRD40615.1 hypothetical protein C5748_25960 [Phyllobacterium phragmitis]